MTECTNQFGGRVSLTIGGIPFVPTEADIKLKTATFEVDSMANQDGSPCYRVKPKLVEVDITFRYASGIVWDDQLLLCSVNATIDEETNGRTHLFSTTRFVGEPTYDVTNGEVSGIKLSGGTYQLLLG